MGPVRKQNGMGPHSQAQQGGMGMGYNVLSAGGKAQGLNFDHVLHKLQVGAMCWELSREVQAER